MKRTVLLLALFSFLIGDDGVFAQEAQERRSERRPPPSSERRAVPRSSERRAVPRPPQQQSQPRVQPRRDRGSNFNLYLDFGYRRPYYPYYRTYPRYYYQPRPLLVCDPGWVIIGYDYYRRPVYDWVRDAYCYYQY